MFRLKYFIFTTISSIIHTSWVELMYSEFYGIYFDKMKQNEATNEMSSGRGLSVTIRGKENLCAGMVDSSRIGYLIKSYNLIYISWHVAMWFGKNNKNKTPVGVFLQAEKGHVKVSTCPFLRISLPRTDHFLPRRQRSIPNHLICSVPMCEKDLGLSLQCRTWILNRVPSLWLLWKLVEESHLWYACWTSAVSEMICVLNFIILNSFHKFQK